MSPRNALLVTLVLAAVAIGLAYSKPWASEDDRSGAAAADLLIPSEPSGAGHAGPAPTQPIPLFDPTSVWNEELAPEATIDPTSAAAVASLLSEVEDEIGEGIGPWISASTCSTPLYVVPGDKPEVRVRLTAAGVSWRAGLAKAFRRVPLPPGATPSSCSDAHLTVWQPASDRLWEFFHLRREDGSWVADWGGAMLHVSRSPGYYEARSWPGLSSWNWGATATSLPVAAGVMRLAELRSGKIDHALAINVPTARAGLFSWPAQRSDGVGSSQDLPEGAHLRLDPNLDLQQLDLPPLTLMIAEAAQRYGVIVRDQTGAGNGISLFAEAPQSANSRPYSRPGGIFDGQTPLQLLAPFPWAHLQLLKLSLCRSGPCHR
jgi:hypothetical protein